jgi:hypothetical protein
MSKNLTKRRNLADEVKRPSTGNIEQAAKRPTTDHIINKKDREKHEDNGVFL